MQKPVDIQDRLWQKEFAGGKWFLRQARKSKETEMNFTETEKSVFEEFYHDKFYRIDFVCGAGDDEDEIEREREASEWCCSDEMRTSENWDALTRLECDGYIYCDDDDYYRLTAKGLEAFREICG